MNIIEFFHIYSIVIQSQSARKYEAIRVLVAEDLEVLELMTTAAGSGGKIVVLAKMGKAEREPGYQIWQRRALGCVIVSACQDQFTPRL
jgi:hypothetical protein